MSNNDNKNLKEYTATFAKEELEERIAEGEVDTDSDVAFLPQGHYQIVSYLRRGLDNPEENAAFQRIYNDGIEKGLRRAVEEDDLTKLAYFRGWKGNEKDVSGIKSLTQLFRIITSPGGRILYVFGNQGAGKTDFVVLVGEMLSEFQDVEIHTNIQSLEGTDGDVEHFKDVEGLKEAIRQEDRTFIILDEASRLLRGENHHEVVEAFRDDLHSLRKTNSNITLIGHSGKDIDPLFRALATFVHKESKENVTLYEDARVTPEGRVDGYGELLSLTGIPPTNWGFDTNEESTFEFNDTENVDYTQEEHFEEVEGILRNYRDTIIRKWNEIEGLTQGEIADKLQEIAEETDIELKEEVFDIDRVRVNQILNPS